MNTGKRLRAASSREFIASNHKLRWSAIAIAIAAAQTVVHAQETTAAQENVGDEIVVTGSRLRTNGMDMPNPVSVVTQDELSIIAPTNLIEGLAELPQFNLSSTTQNPSPFFTSDGAGSLNLRGLNTKRTLQLLNGRRVVQSTIFGGPDINLFPSDVIRSIETVTGGATAAYGTDAVAGAVNFILDTDFEGFRANLSGGANDEGDGEHYEASFTAGFALGENDKTHLLVSLEKDDQDPIWRNQIHDYDWYHARGLVNNPAPGAGSTPDNPFYIAVSDLYSADYSLDGIFHLSERAAVSDQILDANGNPSTFVNGAPCAVAQGEIMGCSTTNGGSGVESGVQGYSISPDSGRESIFAYLEHEFGNLTVYGQVITSEAEFTTAGTGGYFGNPPGAGADRSFTVFSGNPFLPASIQATMTANGIASVPFSRLGALEDIGSDTYLQQVTETDSLTGGFTYDFDGDGFFGNREWVLRGYYQAGQTDVDAIQRGGIRLDRIYLAVDVVNTPAGPRCNVSVVSAANGTPIYQDCVPLNLFGRGRASQAAIDWVTGFEPGVPMHADGFLSATESMPYDYVSGENKRRVIEIQQDVWEISADGRLADGWAGPITMAYGAGFRKESFTQVVEVGPGGNVNADPRYRPVMASGTVQNPFNTTQYGVRGVPIGALASGNSVEIQFSNVPFARGEQDVKEAFTEFLVPLVEGRPGARQLNFSAAARWADYSGAGQVQSWKGGLDWAIIDSLRLRTTVSQDVRAATMGEKFDRTGGFSAPFNDLGISPVPPPYTATQYSNGSPDIKPEIGKTKTLGFVYQPAEVDGLSLSVDWYEVVIKDNIQQVTAQTVINGCYQENEPFLCSLITREGAPVTPGGTNTVSLIGVPYYNQAAVEATGVDLEVNYRRGVNFFGGGDVGLRFLATLLDERNNISSTGTVTRLAGTFGLPEWSSLVQGTYYKERMSFALSWRWTEDQLANANWNFNGTSTRWDVLDNEIAAENVVDARFNYRLDTGSGGVSFFLSLNNLLDEKPEENLAVFSTNFSSGTGLGVTGENRGRRASVGVNVDFGR